MVKNKRLFYTQNGQFMRISKLTTRAGDGGLTFFNGQKIPKNAREIHALGDLDELNSFIGLLRANVEIPFLEKIQHALFSLGRDMALPAAPPIFPENFVKILEKETQMLLENLPTLPEFILPAGNQNAALAHICRAVCRRAERSLVANGTPNVFLNRLSDYFFALARTLNDSPEVFWKKDFYDFE